MTSFSDYFKNLAFNSISVPNSIKNDPKLNGNTKLIYAELLFRMRLSVKKGSRFFNRRFKQFYIIFPVKELSRALGFSKNTTSRALNKLEKRGLILRLRLYHRTLIFTPKLFEKLKQNRTTKIDTGHQNGDHNISTKTVHVTRIKRDRTKNKVCVKNTRENREISKPKSKTCSKLVNAFSKNWEPNNDDVVKLNQLSNDFSTKIILKAIRITRYKEFRTTAINFITGVVRKMIIEAKQRKQKRLSKPRNHKKHWSIKRRSHSLSNLNKYYDHELVRYAVKLTEASHKIIFNKFNFVAGILFKWHRLGINDVASARNYEQKPGYYQSSNSAQIKQRNLVLEELPNWGRKGYKYDSSKDKASPKIEREAKKIMKHLRCEKRVSNRKHVSTKPKRKLATKAERMQAIANIKGILGD